MKSSEQPTPSASHGGPVTNRTGDFDGRLPSEARNLGGNEPRVTGAAGGPDAQATQLEAIKAMFAQWDEEDKEIPVETADQLQKALEHNRGLHFRVPNVE